MHVGDNASAGTQQRINGPCRRPRPPHRARLESVERFAGIETGDEETAPIVGLAGRGPQSLNRVRGLQKWGTCSDLLCVTAMSLSSSNNVP